MSRSKSHVAYSDSVKDGGGQRREPDEYRQCPFQRFTAVQNLFRRARPGAWQADQAVPLQRFDKCESSHRLRQSQTVSHLLTSLPPPSMSISSACRSGELPPLLGMRSGFARSVVTATISPGLVCPGSPPIQASFLQTCAHSILPYVDR